MKNIKKPLSTKDEQKRISVGVSRPPCLAAKSPGKGRAIDSGPDLFPWASFFFFCSFSFGGVWSVAMEGSSANRRVQMDLIRKNLD